jgi:hypothetical protein
MGVIIAGFGCLIAGFIWWYRLSRVQSRLQAPVVSFGQAKAALTSEERSAIIGELLRQQRWAFALVWFAVALGIVLSGYLIGQVVFSRRFERAEWEGMVGLAGDISVAGGAFRLYKTSAGQLDKILEIVGGK